MAGSYDILESLVAQQVAQPVAAAPRQPQQRGGAWRKCLQFVARFTLYVFVLLASTFVSYQVSVLVLPKLHEYGHLRDAQLAPYPFFPTTGSSHQLAPEALDRVSGANLDALIADVEEMFDHAFAGYMTHAFPMDDLKPITCAGRNSQGGMAITLLDSLDMLYLMGRDKDLRKAVLYISKSLNFDAVDERVHVFEVTIRAVGGLLSGHVLLSRDKRAVPWYDRELLDQAVSLANRLLPAFDTPTGIPEDWLNLQSGKIPGASRQACTACAGTLILEFGVLSRLTGNPIYEEKARHAMVFIYNQRSAKSMVGTKLSTDTGEWLDPSAGVGACIDSYYEYLLKAYLMFGDKEYLEMFVDLYSSNRAHSALSEAVGGMVWPVDVHMTSGRVVNPFISSLAAFWPGMQVMAGQLEDGAKLFWHWDMARRKFGLLPESFAANLAGAHPTMAYYPLRPEHIESGYVLYSATHKLEFMAAVAENHMALRNKTSVRCGFAGVGDVPSGNLEDKMESFFISETLKYLYLLYTKRTDVLDQYVLSTEAHFLPTFPADISPSGASMFATARGRENDRRRRGERDRVEAGQAGSHLEPCAAVCRSQRAPRQAQPTLPVLDHSDSRIRERRCDVCLALADAIPEKKRTAVYQWRAAARHPLKASLASSAPRALALDEEEHFEGVRHFMCAMVYHKTNNSVDCSSVWEVSLDDMNSQSLQMLPQNTIMFQLKGQRRREVDSLVRHLVELEVTPASTWPPTTLLETTKLLPAVLGLFGGRFFPGCTEMSDIKALQYAWSREMDATFTLDLEDHGPPESLVVGNNRLRGLPDAQDAVFDKLQVSNPDSSPAEEHVLIPPVPACQVEGNIVLAEPLLGCSPLQNAEEVRNGIVIVQRGNCTFHTKAIHAEHARARAMIVMNEDGQPFPFEPDPDSAAGNPPVTIPCVMVGPSDGRFLLEKLVPGARVAIRQPDRRTRVGLAMDVLYGLPNDSGDPHLRDGDKTCPPAPGIFSNTTRREHLVYQYESQVPLQLDMIFASILSTVHLNVQAGAAITSVLDKLARFYQ